MRQYESNPLASDFEDESCVRRAEAQAIRKKKTKGAIRYNKARSFFFPNTTSTFGAAVLAVAFSFLSSGRNACGDFTYFRRNCPFVAAEQHNSKAIKK